MNESSNDNTSSAGDSGDCNDKKLEKLTISRDGSGQKDQLSQVEAPFQTADEETETSSDEDAMSKFEKDLYSRFEEYRRKTTEDIEDFEEQKDFDAHFVTYEMPDGLKENTFTRHTGPDGKVHWVKHSETVYLRPYRSDKDYFLTYSGVFVIDTANGWPGRNGNLPTGFSLNERWGRTKVCGAKQEIQCCSSGSTVYEKAYAIVFGTSKRDECVITFGGAIELLATFLVGDEKTKNKNHCDLLKELKAMDAELEVDARKAVASKWFEYLRNPKNPVDRSPEFVAFMTLFVLVEPCRNPWALFYTVVGLWGVVNGRPWEWFFYSHPSSQGSFEGEECDGMCRVPFTEMGDENNRKAFFENVRDFSSEMISFHEEEEDIATPMTID